MIVKLFDSLQQIEPQQWDAILPDDAGYNYAFLTCIEKNIPGLFFKYLIVYPDDTKTSPLAHAAIYFYKFDMAYFLNKTLKKILNVIRMCVPSFLTFRVMSLAPPLISSPTLFYVQNNAGNEAVKLLFNTIEKIYNESNNFCLMMNFCPDSLQEFITLSEKRDFYKIKFLPLSLLRIRWGSFSNYTSSFRADYRKAYHRHIKDSEENQTKLTIYENFSGLAPTLFSLWSEANQMASFQFQVPLTEDFFYCLSQTMKKNTLLIALEKNNEIQAFMLGFRYNNFMYARYYGRKKIAPEYSFHKLFYRMVEFSIDKGVKIINLGPASYVAKTGMGASLLNTYLLYKTKSPFFSMIVYFLMSKFFHFNIVKKHVFKDQ